MLLRDVSTQPEAEEWLTALAARWASWAVANDIDARRSIVPKWAQPLPKKIPSVLRVDGQPPEVDPVLFDLPVKVKQKSKTTKAAKNARKAQREAFMAAQAKTYLK